MDLNQITIYSSKTQEAAEFYQFLGFLLIVDSLPRYARFECPTGNTTFSIHETSEKTTNNSVVLYLECDDVDSEFKRLSEAGVEFIEKPTDREWLWREAVLLDPDGNKLILYHAGESRKSPPWRVK